MSTAALDRMFALSLVVTSCVACGASPASEAKSPTVTLPANEVVVVPADRVVEECPPESPRMRKVEYVPIEQWQSPDAAKRAEAFIAEDPSRIRSSGPPPPALTMHQPIPETRIWRLGRSGWRY